MGKRGPQPTPTAVLKARGSWRAKARAKKGEPQPRRIVHRKMGDVIKSPNADGKSAIIELSKPTEPMDPPRELRAAGKRMWREAWAELVRMGVLTTADIDRLRSMCMAWDAFVQAHECVERYGLLIEHESTRGCVVMKQNPAVLERHRAWQRYKNESDAFGLAPAARARLTGGNVEADQPAEDAKNKLRFFNGA